jgi:hypothetical protein
MTYGRRLQTLAIVSGLAICAGCGSGSSGFRPRVDELNAIRSSAQTGTCETAPGGIEVCAKPAAPGEGAHCDADQPGCLFTLSVVLRGVEPGTAVIGAVEPQSLSLPWRTSSNVLGPAGDTGELRGELSFVTDIRPGTIGLRALLLYPPGQAPPNLGAAGIDVELLADLDAPRADVLVNWPLEAP